MDVIIVPLRLELRAYATVIIPLLFTTIRKEVFNKAVWTFTADAIKKNIFTKKDDKKDESKPEFLPETIDDPAGTVTKCVVKQVEGRDHTDPAFVLEAYGQDDNSGLTVHYAIGTFPGGTNVQDWTKMGGTTLLAPQMLPGGIPLYWTVKAANEQGDEVKIQCQLTTYDSTLPDGRIEPAYPLTSNPAKMAGTLITLDDSELTTDQNFAALGVGVGPEGNQLVDWYEIDLKAVSLNNEATGELKYFSNPKRGRLVSDPFLKTEAITDEECAKQCTGFGPKCVGFDFAYETDACFLQHQIEGPENELKGDGSFHHFERLGNGFTTWLEYDNLNLEHGEIYIINAKITNVLGYTNYIPSIGTMVDFTPPVPGPVGEVKSDILVADGCKASFNQRCIEVTSQPNHRSVMVVSKFKISSRLCLH